MLRELDFESLDPAHIGDSAGFNYAGGLLHRSLTWYLEDPANGTLGVVGDLATNAGEPSHGDRVWTTTCATGSLSKTARRSRPGTSPVDLSGPSGRWALGACSRSGPSSIPVTDIAVLRRATRSRRG